MAKLNLEMTKLKPCPYCGDKALRKAARKLAWIHQQIDLYDDRQELHEEDYWMDYLTDPDWIDPDVEWKGEE